MSTVAGAGGCAAAASAKREHGSGRSRDGRGDDRTAAECDSREDDGQSRDRRTHRGPRGPRLPPRRPGVPRPTGRARPRRRARPPPRLRPARACRPARTRPSRRPARTPAPSAVRALAHPHPLVVRALVTRAGEFCQNSPRPGAAARPRWRSTGATVPPGGAWLRREQPPPPDRRGAAAQFRHGGLPARPGRPARGDREPVADPRTAPPARRPEQGRVHQPVVSHPEHEPGVSQSRPADADTARASAPGGSARRSTPPFESRTVPPKAASASPGARTAVTRYESLTAGAMRASGGLRFAVAVSLPATAASHWSFSAGPTSARVFCSAPSRRGTRSDTASSLAAGPGAVVSITAGPSSGRANHSTHTVPSSPARSSARAREPRFGDRVRVGEQLPRAARELPGRGRSTTAVRIAPRPRSRD